MTGLSAVAQAVWRAHEQVLGEECVLTETDMKALAAALRAAVVQVAPVSTNARQMKIRDELLAIANELEGMSN
jgi:hypothetical protein